MIKAIPNTVKDTPMNFNFNNNQNSLLHCIKELIHRSSSKKPLLFKIIIIIITISSHDTKILVKLQFPFNFLFSICSTYLLIDTVYYLLI